MTSPPTYKQRKESFVSNHTGGTLTEINLVTLVALSSYFLFCTLQSRLSFFPPWSQQKSYTSLHFITDFLLNALAILMSITAYAEGPGPVLLNVGIVSPAVWILLTTRKPVEGRRPKKDVGMEQGGRSRWEGELVIRRKAFLTVYRGSMMVITCVAILAVDFKVFPRRFAKVENWGTSLMDLGVGSFVFSSGVVSARGVLQEVFSLQNSLSTNTPYRRLSPLSRAISALKGSLPLLILGFIRLATVKATNYAEHLSEYGYHWNFFFTLSLLPPFTQFLQSLIFHLPLPTSRLTLTSLPYIYAFFAVLISSVYQYVLLTTPLTRFLLVGAREPYGLLGWNKEGIFSFIGYLSIFLAGMGTGTLVLPHQGSSANLARKLLIWAGVWVVVFAACEGKWEVPLSGGFRVGLGWGVSRRMANMPYVLWTVAFNAAQVAGFCVAEEMFFGRKRSARKEEVVGIEEEEREAERRYMLATPRVLEAFNREGLPVFLIANILTGIINLTLNTLDMPNQLAMGVLMAYTLVLTGVAMKLSQTQWRKGVGRYLGL